MHMSDRWLTLAVLFSVRTTMAFQFQSVAALGPLIQQDFGVTLADLGLSIGLYLAPGLALALPSGAIGRRYGDKPAVAAGLLLMLCGSAIMTIAASWNVQLIGRFLSGVGGVLLNVLMSKMVTDRFTGKEIATAMAIFVNSWPFGIALALVVLPFFGTTFGVAAAFLLTTGLIAAGLIILAAFYQTPADVSAAPTSRGTPVGRALAAVILAGSIWGLYNAGLGMVFGFGPTMLVERGWLLVTASSTTSLVLWLLVISIPFGGLLADRSGRPDMVLVAGCVGFCVFLLLASRTEAVLLNYIAIGLIGGLSAGPIMSLPARVLDPGTRAMGMGVSTRFSIFWR